MEILMMMDDKKKKKKILCKSSCTGDIARKRESAAIWNLKPEWSGCTTGSREVPGERKPVTRDDDDDDDDNSNNDGSRNANIL